MGLKAGPVNFFMAKATGNEWTDTWGFIYIFKNGTVHLLIRKWQCSKKIVLYTKYDLLNKKSPHSEKHG